MKYINIKYLTIIFLAAVLLPLNVFASDKVSLKVDKKDLEIGDEIKVSVSIGKDIDAYALLGTLKYDKNVFQKIDDSNFSVDELSSVSYSSDTNKFGITNKSGKISMEDGKLFTVRLKVRNDASVGETNIALTNISYSDGDSKKTLDKVSTKVSVTRDAKEKEVLPTNKENKVKEDKEKDIVTFYTMPIIIVLGIIALILLIVIIYFNLRNDEKKKSLSYLVGIEIFIILLIIILLIMNINKKDVNKDGKKDYKDAEEIIDYLIDIEGTKEDENKNNNDNLESSESSRSLSTKSKKGRSAARRLQDYDVNNDGKVDIEDAGNTVGTVTKETSVSLRRVNSSEENNDDEYYVTKGKITLKFTADINPTDVRITKAKIGDKYYDVEYKNGVYSVLIDDYNIAGKHDFVIKGVKLSNGEERGTNLKITKEVLKDVPTINIVENQLKHDNMEFTFELDDNDEALTRANIVIFKGTVSEDEIRQAQEGSGVLDQFDEDGNKLEPDDFHQFDEVYDKSIQVSDFPYTLNIKDAGLELGGVYTICVFGEYDLDSDSNNQKNNYGQEIIKNSPKTITIGNLTIKPKSDNDIYLTKNEEYKFNFEALFEPEDIKQGIVQVIVDGDYKDIDITSDPDNNSYVVGLKAEDSYGVKSFHISGVVLADRTEMLCDYDVKYEVLKEEPKIENFMYHKKDKKIIFSLNDPDDAFYEGSIKVTDQSGREILNRKLDLSSDDFEFDVDLQQKNTYKVSIVASYDLDSNVDNNLNDGQKTFEHELKVFGVTLSTDKDIYYVEKGSKEVSVKFNADIEPKNDNTKITKVNINGEDLPVTFNADDGSYTVQVEVPDSEEALKNISIKKVVIDEDVTDEDEINEEIEATLPLYIDVLKDVPKIKDFLIDESKDDPEVSFTLEDFDNALEKNIGNLIIRGNNVNETFPLNKYIDENNKVTISLKNLKEGGIYNLDITVDYDLDSDKESAANKVKDYPLIENHEFKIYNATLLQTKKEESEYAKKNENLPFYIEANISPSEKVQAFVLDDGTVAPAKEVDGVYYIELEPEDDFGEHTYTIKKVILENNVEVKVEEALKLNIYILKDMPYINRLNLNEDNTSLSYELTDPDTAFMGGKLNIYDSKKSQVKSIDIDKSGKIDFKFEDGETYFIEVIGSYNLDELKDNKNEATDVEMSYKSFVVGGDYNFTLTNESITDAIEEGEMPVVSFTSTNARNAIVNSANLTANDKDGDYTITKVDGDNYEIALKDADTSPGKHTVTLNNVSLDSLKTFYNNKDYKTKKLTYTVLKASPKVEDLEVVDNHNDKNVKATFKLKDDYESVNKLTVVLVDSTGKIVSKKEIEKDDLNIGDNIEVLLSYANNSDGRYTVKVLGDYALSDNYKYTNKSLLEKEILTNTEDDIYISDMYIEGGNLYPTKGKADYKIIFTVHVGESVKAIAPAKYGGRNYNKIQTITINGLNYTVDKMNGSTDTDYIVRATITVPSDAGIMKIKANIVQLGMDGYYNMTRTDMYSVKEKEITIDVLKDKPKIENLTITDNYEESKATFDFDVVLDKTEKKENFKDGLIKLGNKTDNISEGHNRITFTDIDKNNNLDLIFTGSYDLDTDTIEENSDKNETKNGELFKTKYGLYDQDIYDNIAIEDAEVISEKENNYFEKNEKIKLNFDITNIDPRLEATPLKVIIADKEYAINETSDGYELLLDGYHSPGEKEITVTGVILSNGKKVTLKNPHTFKPEVLKDIPVINDFSYENKSDKVKIKFNLKDPDNSVVGKAKVIITDEKGEAVDYNDELEFNKSEGILRYYVKVVADYDRDIDITKGSANYKENFVLLDEIVSLEENNIELKNITNVNLYKSEGEPGNEEAVFVDEISEKELNEHLDSYFVEVVMENMATVHAKIKEAKEVEGHLILVLDYDFVTRDDGNESKSIRIDFGKIKDNGKAANETHPEDAFRVLLEELRTEETVTLTHDYDASGVEVEGETYISKELKGTLDGNGFKIKNLSKPLYDNINGGTVKDLVLEDINLSSTSGKGSIANTATNATFKNILIDSFTKNNNTYSGVGTLVGSGVSSTVENCRSSNFSISSPYFNYQSIGGLIGSTTNTSFENCYTQGSIVGGWNFRGGLVGNASGGTFKHNYANVYLDAGWQRGLICGLACGGGGTTFKDNISFSNGVIDHKVFQNYKESDNNFYLGVDGDPETEKTGVMKVSSSEVVDDLFSKSLGFSSENWNIKNTAVDNLPKLHIEKISSVDGKDNEDYEETKENLYKNLLKLAPFYDSDKIIDLGKNVNDPLLMDDAIVHIVPVDASGNIVTYLTTDDSKKISKIKLVFKSGTKKEYNVLYDKTYDMVATYKITDLNIDYNYDHYVINSDSQVVNNLTNYLKGLDYTNNLDVLTTNDDSRIYRDFYNETTKNGLKDFVLKYLSNSNYTNTTDIDAINSYLEREVKQDKKIEKALYVYNYFRRFYDLDIEGMKLYDFVMFDMQGFNDILTPEKIAELYLSDASGANFNTNVTNTIYNKILSNYTGLKNLSSFLEFVVTHFSDNDMDKWTASQFKGILVEVPVAANKDIQYTLWDHFSNEDDEYKGDKYAVYNYILPILTLPETAGYIISAPAQFTIGAQRVYMSNPNDPVQLANFKDKMKVYTDRITSYYNTAYSILQDPKLFNDIHLYQIDKRTTKNENGLSVYNNPYSTNEPFHKNFDEVVNLWPADHGVNAGNWGDRIEWNVAGFMDSDIKNNGIIDSGHPTWATWSHETAHYLDDRLFLKDHDRRFNAGGEDYADEFLMQKFGLGVVMNLSIHYNDDVEVATNLTPERINDKDKIWDFYSKMFESIYALDYIEAQAFLKLTPEQKAEIGIQVNYPDYETYKDSPTEFYQARLRSGFNQRTASEWSAMKLDNINDLIDNKIMLYPGVYKFSSRASNSYGGEGINIAHWYQPNNPTGRPDSYALKWLSYEMLGYKGYDNGFVQYASNIDSVVHEKDSVKFSNYKTDDMAITKISDGAYTTIDNYKKARFEKTASNLQHLKYINVDSYAQRLYDALVEDAKTMKEKVTKRLNDWGGEDNCLGNYWCYTPLFGEDRGYPNSTQVRKEMYFELKRKTKDFTEDIYSNDINQPVTFDIKTTN